MRRRKTGQKIEKNKIVRGKKKQVPVRTNRKVTISPIKGLNNKAIEAAMDLAQRLESGKKKSLNGWC